MESEEKKAESHEAEEKTSKRKPYEKPGFLSSVVFERTSLACGSGLNVIPGQCVRSS